MANREFNTRNEEWYWKQSEIVKRMNALRKDFHDMLEVHVDLAVRKLRTGKASVEFIEGYAEGLEDASMEIAFCLDNRFNEISRELQRLDENIPPVGERVPTATRDQQRQFTNRETTSFSASRQTGGKK